MTNKAKNYEWQIQVRKENMSMLHRALTEARKSQNKELIREIEERLAWTRQSYWALIEKVEKLTGEKKIW